MAIKDGEKKSMVVLPKWALWAVAVIIVAAGIFYWVKKESENSFFAVYVRTGEIYFGKLSYFPHPSIADVYVLQLTGDKDNPYSVSRFKDSVWGPEGTIYLNSENVVWKAKLASDSKIIEMIKSNQGTVTSKQ